LKGYAIVSGQKGIERGRNALEDCGMADYKQRYAFIDLLRFVAAFFMIQGHVFDALLSTHIKANPSFYMYDFFHGFVAPAFLLASGVAYGASTMKRWDEHITWGERARRRIQRFLGLIAIGYALHLPYFSLRKTMGTSTPTEIKALLQSDVLQCIGITLLLLQIGILLVRQRRAFEWVVGGFAAGVILVAPLTWPSHFSEYLPMPVVAYLTPENGSWFPLFPWSAYILCGVLFGCILVNAKDPARTASVMRKYAALNVGTLILALTVMYLPFDIYPSHDFWKSNPTMFLVRLNAVGLVASAIFLVERWWKSIPDFPSIIGRESLFVYVVHLVIVYGSVVNRGLSQRIGPTLQVAGALAVFAVVFAVIGLITVQWYRLKTRHERIASVVTLAGAAAFLLMFAIRPW
jgi:uncharacterized membrane protein